MVMRNGRVEMNRKNPQEIVIILISRCSEARVSGILQFVFITWETREKSRAGKYVQDCCSYNLRASC